MASVSTAVIPAQAQTMEKMVPKSSFIALLEYDPQNLTLTTHLKSGAIYQHKFVLPLEWKGLQTAQNHGKHWAANIKGKKLSVKVKHVKSPNSQLKKKGR